MDMALITIAVNKIDIGERIRERVSELDEFARNIEKHGLINPITVMRLDSGRYKLLAGLRRYEAVKTLKWTEISANVLPLKDAEETLLIEISENTQRHNFTPDEIAKYGRMLEAIEAEKAKVRIMAGKKADDPPDGSPGGEVRDIIGEKLGISGRQYKRNVYVADHATQEDKEAIARKEKSVYGVYNELRQAEKPKPAPLPPTPPSQYTLDDALTLAAKVENENSVLKRQLANEKSKREVLNDEFNNRLTVVERKQAEIERLMDENSQLKTEIEQLKTENIRLKALLNEQGT